MILEIEHILYNYQDLNGTYMNKLKMKNERGSPITENLFLEIGYSEHAIYTLKDEDYEYKGKLYPSIKRIYLEEAISPEEGEYEFANKNFINWRHWQRICRNRRLRTYIDEWRGELEVKRRAEAIKDIINTARNGNYSAAKWVAEGQFCKRAAGRPSKEQLEAEYEKDKRLLDDFSADIVRLKGI